jgi:hypothetical protein
MLSREGSVDDVLEYNILEITVSNWKINMNNLFELLRSTHDITVPSDLKTHAILPR